MLKDTIYCCSLKFFTSIIMSPHFLYFIQVVIINPDFRVDNMPWLSVYIVQEVKDAKAKLGPKVISVLETRKMSSQEFYRRTGGTLCIQTWTVTGNLLVLQHVQKFLKDLVEEFERPKIPETWTPNAEYYIMGMFHV